MSTSPASQEPVEGSQSAAPLSVQQAPAADVTTVSATGRQALRNLRRQLGQDDLASPGVQMLLLDALERADADCEGYREYIPRFYDADKRAAIFEERLKALRIADILQATCLTLGGVLVGSDKGPVVTAIGSILIVAAIITYFWRRS